jgi:photosystem II stability/assembly factor-like uncharacterized protein
MYLRILFAALIMLSAVLLTGCEDENSAYAAPQWTVHSSASLSSINAIKFTNPMHGIAVGDDSSAQLWDGQIWNSQVLAPLVNLRAVCLLGYEAWVVGDGGHIFHMTDGGFWSPVASPTDADLFGVMVDDSGRGWAVGRDGTILELDHGVWLEAASPTSQTLRALDKDNNGVYWAVGDGVALYCVNGTWIVDESFPTDKIATSLDITDQNMIAVGYDGMILLNEGEGWVEQSSGTDRNLWGVARDSSGNGWAVGDLGISVRIGADGSYRPEQLEELPDFGRPFHCVDTLSVDEAWAGTEEGLLFHYF